MIKTIIADTQESTVENLTKLLQKIQNVTIVSSSAHRITLKEILQKQLDLLFLDINILLCEANDILSAASRYEFFPHIVFLTESNIQIIDTLTNFSFPHILKPLHHLTKNHLIQTIEKIRHTVPKSSREYEQLIYSLMNLNLSTINQEEVTVYDENRPHNVCYRDISFFYETDGKTCVSTGSNTYICQQTLYEAELDLPPFFIRTHQRYIVNIHYIESIQPWFNGNYQLNVSGTVNQLPLSRHYVDSFKKITHFM